MTLTRQTRAFLIIAGILAIMLILQSRSETVSAGVTGSPPTAAASIVGADGTASSLTQSGGFRVYYYGTCNTFSGWCEYVTRVASYSYFTDYHTCTRFGNYQYSVTTWQTSGSPRPVCPTISYLTLR